MSRQSKYDENFRKHAVSLATSGGTASQTARDLGIGVKTLYRWIRNYRNPDDHETGSGRASGAGSGTALPKELDSLRKENNLLKMEHDILKKAVGIFSRPPAMKYNFIHMERSHWPIVVMCRVLEVPRSGYYAWRYRKSHPGTRATENAALMDAIRQVHRTSKERYGSPRITAALRRHGWRCSRGRVARLMSANAIRANRRRSYRVTTRSNHLLASPNRITRNFTALEPNCLWVTDITYIETREGFLYTAAIMDLFSRRIVGLAMRADLSKQLVIDALMQALQRRQPKPGLILHSDRGSQYSATRYRHILHTHGILQSMSRKGDCWDNAPMESFFKTLKVEEIYQRKYETRQQARQSIFEYIEIFYNRQRLHSTIGYEAPETFEANTITTPINGVHCL